MATFHDLPEELVAQITESLSPSTLLCWARVNRRSLELSRLKLRDLSQKYATLDLDGGASTYRKVMDILKEPILGELVREICGESWFIPDPDLPSWPMVFKEKSDNEEFATLWEERATELGLLGITQELEMDAILDNRTLFMLKRTIALCFPLFPWIRRISTRGENGFEMGSISHLVQQQVKRLFLPDTLVAPNTFSLLEDVRIDCCATQHSVRFEDVLRFLKLPNLKIFHANDVIGYGDGNPEPHDAQNDKDILAIRSIPSRCRLQELQLLLSNVSDLDIEIIFEVINAAALQSFKLQQASVDTEDDGAMYHPREIVRTLAKCCHNTLEKLDLQTDSEMLGWHLDMNADNDDYYEPDSEGAYSLYKASLDIEHNLQKFSSLKSITINAEMLLNGFGAVTRADAAAQDGNGQDERQYDWIETDPYEALPISHLLPPSLEVLRLSAVQDCQIEVLNEKFEELFGGLSSGQSPESFPALKEVIVGEYVEDWSPGKTVWSLEEGFEPLHSVE